MVHISEIISDANPNIAIRKGDAFIFDSMPVSDLNANDAQLLALLATVEAFLEVNTYELR